MKTGFTCAAGFNVVASANHYGRHLIAVVLGAPSARLRNQEAADLFDRGFAMGGGSGSLESLPSAGRRRPIGAPTSACTAARRRSSPKRRTAAAASRRRTHWRARRRDGCSSPRRARRRTPQLSGRAARVRPGAGVHRTGPRLERAGPRTPRDRRGRRPACRRQGLRRRQAGRDRGCDRAGRARTRRRRSRARCERRRRREAPASTAKRVSAARTAKALERGEGRESSRPPRRRRKAPADRRRREDRRPSSKPGTARILYERDSNRDLSRYVNCCLACHNCFHNAIVWPVCGQARAARRGHLVGVPRGIGSRFARFSCPPAPERQVGPKISCRG